MQLKASTDYAIRILLYLAGSEGIVSTKELSDALGIAESYLPKTAHRLRNRGWVTSMTGAKGGYVLSCDPTSVTLWDIADAMEDTVRMNRCLEDDGYCSRFATATCPVHKVYEAFQECAVRYFSYITVADLLDSNGISEFQQQVLEGVRKATPEKVPAAGGSAAGGSAAAKKRSVVVKTVARGKEPVKTTARGKAPVNTAARGKAPAKKAAR